MIMAKYANNFNMIHIKRFRAGKISRHLTYIYIYIYISIRKCQDYVYVKWEYWSTMQQIEHFLRQDNKVNEIRLLAYCEPLRYM